MNVGHVQGGTNAGWRRVKAAHEPWLCGCFELLPVGDTDEKVPAKKLNPGYRGKCSDCGERRPT